MDEGPTAKPIAVIKKQVKLKAKPKPHYLTGTAASKAMQRPKSPMLNTGPGMKSRGINMAPMSLSKKKPTMPLG